MPFIYVGCRISVCDVFMKTRKSNALPPLWDQSFDFVLEDNQTNTIEIVIAESRLMMVDEELGKIKLPVSWLPYNYVVTEWVEIKPSRKHVNDIRILAQFHLCDPDSVPFSHGPGQFLATVPWNPMPVEQIDLENIWNPNEAFIPPVVPSDVNQYRVRMIRSKYLFNSYSFGSSYIPLVAEEKNASEEFVPIVKEN